VKAKSPRKDPGRREACVADRTNLPQETIAFITDVPDPDSVLARARGMARNAHGSKPK